MPVRPRILARWTLALLLSGCVRAAEAPPATPLSATRAPTLVLVDADADWFADDHDACPQTPGVAPDGCPALDSDGDGVRDHIDACPNYRGVKPHGCRLPDEDRDTVADIRDQCPGAEESRNGFFDGDGCPDELPEDLIRVLGPLHGVQFERNKDNILPESRPALDRLIKVLAKYPGIRIEISGHSDDTGMVLRSNPTRRQANAVKQYLVRYGIAEQRLETRGVGSDEPRDTNKTAAGRALNRRIEITLLVP